MIQFNLLPDVKLAYVKATRAKHLVMLVSFIVTGVSVALVVMLFIGVNVLQKKNLNDLDKDIKEKSAHLQSIEDIDKILTVQNQLKTLNGDPSKATDNGLHDIKPAAERLGPFLSEVTPSKISISEVAVDFMAGTLTIDGDADKLKTVNQFVDTLKFTTYEASKQLDDGQQETSNGNAFSNVVLASFSLSGEGDKVAASYQITLKFEPKIFDITKTVRLVVPDQVTTRSITERPEPLFQPNEGGGQQ